MSGYIPLILTWEKQLPHHWPNMRLGVTRRGTPAGSSLARTPPHQDPLNIYVCRMSATTAAIPQAMLCINPSVAPGRSWEYPFASADENAHTAQLAPVVVPMVDVLFSETTPVTSTPCLRP